MNWPTLSPDRTWHKINDPKVDYSGGLEWGKVQHEPRLDYAGHRPTSCNVGLMSLAGHGPKSGQQVLYKDDKGVNNAARPLEGDPAEAGYPSTSNLKWSIDRPARMLNSPLRSLCTKQRLIKFELTHKGWHIIKQRTKLNQYHQT